MVSLPHDTSVLPTTNGALVNVRHWPLESPTVTLKFSSPPLTETLIVSAVLTSGVGSSSELSPWTWSTPSLVTNAPYWSLTHCVSKVVPTVVSISAKRNISL